MMAWRHQEPGHHQVWYWYLNGPYVLGGHLGNHCDDDLCLQHGCDVGPASGVPVPCHHECQECNQHRSVLTTGRVSTWTGGKDGGILICLAELFFVCYVWTLTSVSKYVRKMSWQPSHWNMLLMLGKLSAQAIFLLDLGWHSSTNSNTCIEFDYSCHKIVMSNYLSIKLWCNQSSMPWLLWWDE